VTDPPPGLTVVRIRHYRWWRISRWLPRRPRLRYHVRQGREAGFPPCCIAWFCAFAWVPHRAFDRGWLWNVLRVPNGRGYVPCPWHYRR
jgi:hypothetical protein